MATGIASSKYGERFQVGMAGQSVEVPYLVKGATDRDDARAAIIAAAPANVTIGGLILALLTVDADEFASTTGVWEGRVHYGVPQYTSPKATGDSSFQFETGGGSQHITQSFQTVAAAACPGTTTAPDYHGAIGVNGDGDVAGCDIVAPVFRFSITAYFAPSAITQTYLGNLYRFVGNVNNQQVTVHINGVAMTFAIGELLFEGAAGGMRGTSDMEITFRLAASPNVTDLCATWPTSVKPAGAVPKKGWEYAWISYQPDVDSSANAVVRRPRAVYVEQVYPYADLRSLNVP